MRLFCLQSLIVRYLFPFLLPPFLSVLHFYKHTVLSIWLCLSGSKLASGQLRKILRSCQSLIQDIVKNYYNRNPCLNF